MVMLLATHAKTLPEGNMSQVLGCPHPGKGSEMNTSPEPLQEEAREGRSSEVPCWRSLKQKLERSGFYFSGGGRGREEAE